MNMIGERWRRQQRKVARLGDAAMQDWSRAGSARRHVAQTFDEVGKPRLVVGSFVAGALLGLARRGRSSGRAARGGVSLLRLVNTALVTWRMFGAHHDGPELS